jgi:hypothetical protein
MPLRTRLCALCRPTSVALSAMLATTTVAQWSDDPSVNTPIADAPGDQVQPKVRTLPDGGCYVSWFDNETGGYDVRVLRLDPTGAAAWPASVLVADRSFSSTQDYGASIDVSGASLLAFRDDRGSGEQITAQRISPEGGLMWGDGVVLTATSEFVASPRIAGTSDGGAVVAWSQGNFVRLAKISAGGKPQWERTVTGPGGNPVTVGDLQASDAPGATGEVVLSLVRFGGFTTPRHLYAQKYDATGEPMWGASPLTVFDAGSLQFGNFPPFVADGEGGAVLAWYSSSPSLQSFVQRVFADGSVLFGPDGQSVAEVPGQIRTAPSATIDRSTGDIYCFWTESNSAQSQFGVRGQRFAGGSRQWGSGGLVVVPLGSTEVSFVRTAPRAGGASALWIEGDFASDAIPAFACDADGNAVWGGEVAVSSSTPPKSRLEVATLESGTVLAVWQSGASGGASDVFAQNLRSDGTLGVEGIEGDLNDDGEVNGADLSILLASWGPCPPKAACPADLNGDGVVNGADLGILLANWG